MAGLMGLLGNAGLMQDLGTGLLSQSGWSATPVSLGQAFGGAMQFANTRQADRLALEAARQKVEQEKARGNAMNQLQGLLQPPTAPMPGTTPGVPMIQTPAGQAQAMGLLGQIAPEAMAQGLFAQMFKAQEAPRVSTDLATFRSLNPHLVPGSAAEREAFASWSQSQETLSPVDQMRLNEATLGVLKLQQELEGTRGDERTEEQLRAVHSNGMARNLLAFRTLNNALSESFLATGSFGVNARRPIAAFLNDVRDAMGADSTEYRNLLAQRDELENLAAAIVTQRSEAAGAGIGRTDAGRALLAAEKPGLGLAPSANNIIVDRMLQDLLAEAQATGTYIDPAIAQQIQELSGQNYRSVPATPQAGSIAPPGATPPSMNFGAPPMPDIQAEMDKLNAEIRALEAQLRGK